MGQERRPDIIVPTPIAVPEPGVSKSGKQPPKRSQLWLVAAIFLVCVAGLCLVYSFSSGDDPRAEKPQPLSLPADTPTDSLPAHISADITGSEEGTPESVDPGSLLLGRESAEESLGAFLDKKRTLEEQGVLELGDETYADVLGLGKEADKLFLAEDFEAAISAYDKAMRRCEALTARIPTVLPKLLREGSNALDKARGSLAQRKFGAALKIDSTNKYATVGFRRARTIDRVTSLMASGSALEKRGRVALALTDYQEAARLDPLHEAAAAAVLRAGEKIKRAEFQELMTQGLRAFAKGDIPLSEEKFLKAKGFYPESREVQDALIQVEEKRRLARIRKLSEEATAAEKQENRSTAYDNYREILRIDPHIRVAAEGSKRMAKRIRLEKKMQYYLKHPESLLSDQGRKKATLTLYEAKELTGAGGRWDTMFSSFEEAVTLATTPVRAILKSDGATRVDVYRVGRFGPFQTKQLSLLPGTYTVVGHRKGFRDVRLALKVVPGREPVRQTVICRDQI